MNKKKIIGAIKATRPQFIFAYFIIAAGGLIIGLAQHFTLNISLAIYSFIAVGFAVAGINCRDEAYDWVAGYDIEYGGMGVIRDGTFEAKTLRKWGIILDVIAVGLFVIQLFYFPLLIIPLIPGLIVMIGANYLTEEIRLGHELMPPLSFLTVMLWLYLSQGWYFTLPIILFSVYTYLIVLTLLPYQDIGDREADEKSGKKTLTVKMGLDRVGMFSIFMGLISSIVLYLTILSLTA